MTQKYPVKAGWFYTPGLGNGYTSCIGPSPFGEECGHSLVDAVMGFNLTNHRPIIEILKICAEHGRYTSFEDIEEEIVFDQNAYDRWMALELPSLKESRLVNARSVIEDLSPWASAALSDPSVSAELRSIFQDVLTVKAQNDKEFEEWALRKVEVDIVDRSRVIL